MSISRSIHIAISALALALTLLLSHTGVAEEQCPWNALGFATLEAKQFRHLDQGPREARALVLLHGWNSFSGTFRTVASELARDYRLVRIDLRGHGGSPAAGINYSTLAMARDVVSILDLLGLDRATFLGHSMGARVAARLGQAFPQRTSGLVFEDIDLHRVRPFDGVETLRANLARLEAQVSGRTFENQHTLKQALIPFFGEAKAAFLSQRTRTGADGRVSLKVDPKASYLYYVQGLQEDLGPALATTPHPVLAVGGDPGAGGLLTEAGVDHLKRHAPLARVVRVPGANHLVHRTQPEAYVEAVRKFLRTPD